MGNGIRTLAAAAVVVFGFAGSAAAQPDRTLTGLVRDQAGMPLPGVVVKVEHPQETAVRVVVTDLRGEYEVPNLERGTTYKVEVSHPRFRRKALQAEAGDRITVRMKPRRGAGISETVR